MKRIVLAMLVLLLSAGWAVAKEYEVKKTAGDYTIVVKIDKNPPVTGQNHMQVAVTDKKGETVSDAVLDVDYGMPAMPGMPAMNYKTKAAPMGKSYMAMLDFSMSGAWTVTVKINRGGKVQSVKLNVDVR
jgi:hypothetical protein